MQALTHLFGSTDGYRTLARASGVSDAEDAALAALGFGSPRTAEEFEALATSPCMAGRLLSSGRYAITRVFPGPTDVAGRRTVERRTLVLSNEAWLQLAGCNLWDTLLDDRNWDRQAFADGSPMGLQIAASEDLLPVADETDQRTFDALLHAHEVGRCAALPLQDRFNRSILRLPSLMPTEQAMALGWGIGLWAVPNGVWLATLRSPSNGRNCFVAPTAGAWRHPERLAALRGDRARGIAANPSRPEPNSPSNWARPASIATGVLTIAILLLIGMRVLWTTPDSNAAQRPTPPATTTPESTPTPSPSAAPATTTAQPSGSAGGAPPAPATVRTDPPAFTGASAVDPAFGSGTPTNAPTPAVSAGTTTTPPAQAPTPAPTPTPPPAPSTGGAGIAPAPPAQSTTWDRQVDLLRQTIDLRLRLRGSDGQTMPPNDWLREASDLLALSKEVHREARDLETALRSLHRTETYRLVSLDADAKRQPGIAEDLARKKAGDAALGAETLRQMALLMARMELALSAQALLARTAQDAALKTDPTVLKALAAQDLERLAGWPSTPFSNWYAANTATRRTPLVNFVPLVARLLGSAVDPNEARSLLEQLKREEQVTAGGSATP